jgi:alkylation response protein AidB-like acyl-CoA dehydrogenase
MTDRTAVTIGSVDAKLVQEAVGGLVAEFPPATTAAPDFARARFDAGLAWVWFPVGLGGLDVPPALQELATELLTEAGAPEPPANGLGTGMAGPTVAAHGTDAQRRRWLSRIFCSGEWWCQLFSEPGAGSDIASLACKAVADDDEWVVNGQKVWTSGAQHSDWGLLVARTDGEVPKHRGMSFFIVDMHTVGIEVRPLRNMTGLSEFNEVFLTNVRLSDADRLGPVGGGWRVLMATLMNERLVFTGGGGPTDATVLLEDALQAWQDRADKNPALRDRLAQTWIEVEVQRLFNLRAAEARKQGTPGHEGSLGKVAATELNKRVTELTMDLLGPAGILLPGPYTDGRSQRRDERAATPPVLRFLRARANTIEVGTSEVQRNNIADHVLGLPAEDRLDKTLPWSEVPRSI